MHCKALCVAFLGALIVAFAPAARAQDYIPDAALRDAGLSKFWQLALPLAKDQRIVNIYHVDDTLYATTNDGYVFAVHARTGVLLYFKQIGDKAHRVREPVHAGERTIFLTDLVLTELDRNSGDGILQRDLRHTIGSAPASDGERIFHGSINHRFYSNDVYTGYEIWKVQTFGRISSRPVVSQGFLFVASHDGRIYSCTAANKRAHWISATSGPNSADLAIDENGLYVASEDHSLYLLDVGFGQVRWRARFSGPLYDAPVITPGVAYQYSRHDGLVAVNTATIDVEERFRWKMPHGLKLLTVDDRYAFVLTANGAVAAADLETGEIDHVIATRGFNMGAPDPLGGAVYLIDERGRLFCARSSAAPPLNRDELRQALAGRKAELAEQEAAPLIEPPPRRDITELLRSSGRGIPLGGRSKVTREYKEPEDPDNP